MVLVSSVRHLHGGLYKTLAAGYLALQYAFAGVIVKTDPCNKVFYFPEQPSLEYCLRQDVYGHLKQRWFIHNTIAQEASNAFAEQHSTSEELLLKSTSVVLQKHIDNKEVVSSAVLERSYALYSALQECNVEVL